jgi:hypothetical protein
VKRAGRTDIFYLADLVRFENQTFWIGSSVKLLRGAKDLTALFVEYMLLSSARL